MPSFAPPPPCIQGHGGKFGLDGARVDKFIDDGEGKLVKLKSTQRYRALMRTFFKVWRCRLTSG